MIWICLLAQVGFCDIDRFGWGISNWQVYSSLFLEKENITYTNSNIAITQFMASNGFHFETFISSLIFFSAL